MAKKTGTVKKKVVKVGAVGIGEGRVGFPNAFGQTAKGFLRLNTVVLPILLDFGKVNHGFPPLRAL